MIVLCTCVSFCSFQSAADVIVVGTCVNAVHIDPSFRRLVHLGSELELPVPSNIDRLDVS